MGQRNIAVITGTRADYGIYYHVLKAIQEQPKLRLSLIVTGMHLLPAFGNTIEEIEKDGFPIDAKVEMQTSENMPYTAARSIGKGLMGFADVFNENSPDVVLVLGDRGEMLAAVTAANYMNIPVAHIHGGDKTGTVDEVIRHAITKLAHIHFPATDKSAERIKRMGEEESRIFKVGSPALDYIKAFKRMGKGEIAGRFDVSLKRPLVLMTQHPVSSELSMTHQQITETMSALEEIGEQTIITYPNSDPGNREIIDVIEKYRGKNGYRLFKNLSQTDYLNLLTVVEVMVGNSSSGIIEASSFGLPVVNIGTRQDGREKTSNVIQADYAKDDIVRSIRYALQDKEFRDACSRVKNPYGDGKAGLRIAKVLSEIELTPGFVNKQITY